MQLAIVTPRWNGCNNIFVARLIHGIPSYSHHHHHPCPLSNMPNDNEI
jgi:hypothetical protein